MALIRVIELTRKGTQGNQNFCRNFVERRHFLRILSEMTNSSARQQHTGFQVSLWFLEETIGTSLLESGQATGFSTVLCAMRSNFRRSTIGTSCLSPTLSARRFLSLSMRRSLNIFLNFEIRLIITVIGHDSAHPSPPPFLSPSIHSLMSR